MHTYNLNIFKNLPAREKRITLATCITLMRILLVPFVVIAIVAQQWGWAVALFIVAASTDVIDGALARWRNEKTVLGSLIDPVADKALLLSVFFTLAFVHSPLFAIPHWFVWLMLIKEIVQLLGFVVIYMISGNVHIQPRMLGKLTTMAQVMFVVWLFVCHFFNWAPLKTYYVALGILVTLVFVSFIDYAYTGITCGLNKRAL